MNSDLMPLPESSNSTASKQALESKDTAAMSIDAATPAFQEKNSPVISSETANDQNLENRQQPIQDPSELMQYRAIGLVRGRYVANSSEQFTQGSIVTTDGTQLEAVLLGRMMSLVKNHLDLEKEHLWVVYPRTRQENDKLHLQIVGVWEPENLAKHQIANDKQNSASQEDLPIPERNNSSSALLPSSEVPDGDFSVRGEVVYQSYEAEHLVIKIKQAARKQDDKPKYFKLKIKGKLEARAVGKFWDLQVKRETDSLVVETAEAIADLPKRRRPPQTRYGGASRRPSGKKPFPPRPRNGEIPRPVRKTGDTGAASTPISSKPIPKPVKRLKPPEQ
ncbi:hypothetical protein DP113_31775 [Brasilonema octagenarum UFV-E1]|uniref:Uncharacterized protein n=1 Tax=Brasilonema sennae CENA114 TaxID=415709 RepID=A0A856MQY6_9CYAN|nr:hypothetical protein [Brasilonema sennae]QDL11847.1 hypothetical protein DP114_31645 [Brasilonema sennae CENA114]QDL18226.1 hypothetical protein DP113_31775 [Brasilonema octagenarum UFV-E1]